MNAEALFVPSVTAVGLGATLFMDVWALFLKRAFSIPSANYCLVGRWFRHMSKGTFRHASIADAARKSFECTVGWSAHYLIGVVYAFVFVAFVPESWFTRPTPLPALLFGVGTVLAPFLIMHPMFGLGIAASRTASPAQARVRSLVAHIAYGVGLYVSAVGLSSLG